MKIHPRQILHLKRLLILLVPMLIVLAAGLSLFLYTRRAEEPKQSAVPRVTPRPPAQSGPEGPPKSRSKALLPKIRVIKPVSLVDEAFRGYDLPPSDDEGREKEEEQQKEQEAPCVELPPEQPQKRIEALPAAADSKASAGKRQPEMEKQSGKAGRPPAGGEEAEVLKEIESIAAEAGLSEAARGKLKQSYKDLSKILPRKEAKKMILWKIRQQQKQ